MRSRFAPRILLPLYTAAVIHCVCSALAGLYRLPSEIDYLLENVDLMYFLRELRMQNRTLKSLGKKGLEWLVSPYFGLLCMMLWYNYKLHSGTLLLSSADPCLVSGIWRSVFNGGMSPGSDSAALYCMAGAAQQQIPVMWNEKLLLLSPTKLLAPSFVLLPSHFFRILLLLWTWPPVLLFSWIPKPLHFYISPLFLALRADNTLLWAARAPHVWEPQNPLAQNLHLCKVLALSSVLFWHSRAVPIRKLSHHPLEAFDKGVSTALLQRCVTQPNFGVLSEEWRKAQPLHKSSSWEMRRCEFPAWRFSKEKVTRIC